MRTILPFALLALLLSASAAAAPPKPKPKPWMWTPAQAAVKVDGALKEGPSAFGARASFGRSTCRGTGKAVVAKYVSFACSVVAREGAGGAAVTHRVWVKVRPVGTGGACLSVRSLAAVSPACLAARTATARGANSHERPSPEGAIQNATTARFNPGSKIPWQGFEGLDCFGADGWYACSFASAVSGTASVLYAKTGPPVVTFTSLMCTGAYEGRPECVI